MTTPDFSTERSIAHDFSTRHTTASTFTPAKELAYADLHTERPRPWSVPFSQSTGSGGPMGHPLGGVGDALAQTAGRSMAEAEEKQRKREERKRQYGAQQPMEHQYGPSYGGHDFGQAESEPVLGHEGEETPEERFGTRENGWGGGLGLGGSRWND